MAAGNEALPSAVAMDKVQKAYQSSGQLKEKYKLQDSKFVIEAKDKNKVKVELGETNSADFEPSLTFSRWEGEAKFKIKPDISKVKKNNKGIEIDGEKIKYKAGKKDYVFYDISEIVSTTTDDGKTLGNYSVWGTDGVGRQATTTPATDGGGYELEIVLNSKSDTNVFSDAIESTGVEFYKQKALNEEMHNASTTCTATECKDADGNITASRPDNMVDSIAVYSTGKQGDYTALGGMNYMAGKVAHIYRVKAVDANNDWAWCDQDITDGIWTKTCPQEFLDKAVYPVVIDPTFGYTTAGSSYMAVFLMNGSIFSSGGAGTLSKITAYVTDYKDEDDPIPWSAFSGNWQYAIYDNSGNKVGNTSEYTITGEESDGWFDLSISNTITNQNYWLYVWGGSDHMASISFDEGGTHDRFYYIGANSYNSWPTTLQNTDFGYFDVGIIYSIYATYESGGSSSRRIIITE